MKFETTHRLARRPATVAGATLLLLAAVAATYAVSPPSCATLEPGEIIESTNFTPASEMRTAPIPVTLSQLALEATPAAGETLAPGNALDGLPLQMTYMSGNGLYQYFLDRAIPPSMTLDAFWMAGGIHLARDPAEGGDFAGFLLNELGERATAIDIGPYRGALTWADPTLDGTRTHNLYWSDGEYNFQLIGVRSAVDLANLGRAMVCG